MRKNEAKQKKDEASKQTNKINAIKTVSVLVSKSSCPLR
jgi:hypothetical protein